jgi:branched-chain amino acid aminotransferase
MTLAGDLGYKVVERDIARAELYLADEVFMSGTAAELVPVVEVDDHKVASGRPGEVTRLLQGAFDDAIHGRSERYREWLDPVKPAAAASAASAASQTPTAAPAGSSSSFPLPR